MDIERSSLSLLAGVGIIAIIFFFVFFMANRPGEMIMWAIVLMILSAIMMLFYLFDKLKFAPMAITDTNSNLVAGMLLAIIAFIIIMLFTGLAKELIDALLIIIITVLTSFTTFLLLFSLFMEE
jgi:hypothetical protein